MSMHIVELCSSIVIPSRTKMASYSSTVHLTLSFFLKWRPRRRDMSLGNRKRSNGSKSGEYGGLHSNSKLQLDASATAT